MVFHLRNIGNSEITLVPSGSFSVGREDDNFLCINDGSVSRYHATIFNSGQDIFLEDNGSSNGTALRGQLVSDRLQVTPGDVIYFGSVPFRLEAPDDDASTAAVKAEEASPPKPGLRKATDLVPLEEIGRKLKESVRLPDFSTQPDAPSSNEESRPIPAQPPIKTQHGDDSKNVLNTGEIQDLGDMLRAGAAPGSRRSQEVGNQVAGVTPNEEARPASYGKSTRTSGPLPTTPSGHKPWMHVYGTSTSTPKATTQPMEQPHPSPTPAPAPASSGPSTMLIIILAVGFGFGLGVLCTILFFGSRIF